MTIRDLLAAESINLNGTPAGKTEALNQCIDLMAKSGKIADVEKYRKGVFAREEEGTTGIGMGIAIPHCKSDAVTKAGLAAMVVKETVAFCFLYHITHILHPRSDGTQRVERSFQLIGDNLCQCGLSYPRRPPKYERGNASCINHLPQNCPLSYQVLLSYIIIQRLRTQTFC